ncbi:hypothetical protein ACFX5U_10550 [Sphingobacterium sp. SG20118]|uniref:hypothetical protein n=1 Tax=Sphingobacterium sp. SG20118 TaxID=3367156 RepID=UPI0037DFC2CC
MKNHYKYLAVLIAVLTTTACQKETDDSGTIYCAPIESVVAFQLLDESSNKDLFSIDTGKYKPQDLKLYPFNYTNKSDTIVLKRLTHENNHIFVFANQNIGQSRFLLQVADLPMDTLSYHVIKEPSACDLRKFVTASFNGLPVTPENDLLILKK